MNVPKTTIPALALLALASPAPAQRHPGGPPGGGPRNGGFRGGDPRRGAFHGGFRPAIPVRTYRANEWRHYNPGWHERYYYRGGRYFYDPAYTYPAVVEDEWGGIAGLSGGASVLGFLNHDPYLGFAGPVGALYSPSRYQSDLHSGDPRYRARAAYFARPSFWRGGRRYVRTSVLRGGVRFYRFRRG